MCINIYININIWVNPIYMYIYIYTLVYLSINRSINQSIYKHKCRYYMCSTASYIYIYLAETGEVERREEAIIH